MSESLYAAHYSKRGAKGWQLNGRVATYCRARGYIRARRRPVFWRHTVGIGGAYVFIEEDHVRVQVKELGIDGKVGDLSAFRELLELIDQADAIAEVPG